MHGTPLLSNMESVQQTTNIGLTVVASQQKEWEKDSVHKKRESTLLQDGRRDVNSELMDIFLLSILALDKGSNGLAKVFALGLSDFQFLLGGLTRAITVTIVIN